ncbi:hypothetical protein ANCCAN_27445 [Ancylostoma caninum]|uniref:AMP-dependent synthetase/ligase domain-containing protein n=1 Tax=Ancylostoma caninum TaxID=29170 RepID=A0A368F9H4_ANCCA|nr:hypothetical protein ANCCAN_27445 [Ancylostoma caninum]
MTTSEIFVFELIPRQFEGKTIDEVGERRYITYSDLLKNVNRAANYLHHHGVEKGSHVAICLNNSLEFVYLQMGLYLIGAVPVLLNPGHVGSGRFPRFDCAAVIVDSMHYSHVLRLFDHFVGAKNIALRPTIAEKKAMLSPSLRG